jgi:hypothetical protein
MNTFTKQSKKALLHSLPFAIWLALCCSARAQPSDALVDVKNDEQTIQAKYALAMKACEQKLAPAQCQREAGLAFKRDEQANKVKQSALKAQSRQDKLANNQRLNTVPKQTDLNLLPSQTPRLNQQDAVSADTKKPLTSRTVNTKSSTRKSPLTPQPTSAQRHNNATTVKSKADALTARKARLSKRVAKRQADNAARKAKGFTVDKP